MPINEKEINCYLLDQLELIERLEDAESLEEVKKILARERKFVERKLYQNPPLVSECK